MITFIRDIDHMTIKISTTRCQDINSITTSKCCNIKVSNLRCRYIDHTSRCQPLITYYSHMTCRRSSRLPRVGGTSFASVSASTNITGLQCRHSASDEHSFSLLAIHTTSATPPLHCSLFTQTPINSTTNTLLTYHGLLSVSMDDTGALLQQMMHQKWHPEASRLRNRQRWTAVGVRWSSYGEEMQRFFLDWSKHHHGPQSPLCPKVPAELSILKEDSCARICTPF